MAETPDRGTNGGVRFPFISLEKAIGRAKELYDADPKGREMSVSAAFTVWNYSEKSSGGFQTVGALIMYGILKDTGSSTNRKLSLTDDSLRYFRDEREDERKRVLRHLALRPKLIATLWKDWHTTPPADTVARSHLKADRGFQDQAARALLAIYKENLAFADLKGDDKPLAESGDIEHEQDAAIDPRHGESSPPAVTPIMKVGDFVQWTSAGVEQFREPAQVTHLQKDYAFVHGSKTGIPISELSIVDPPKSPPTTPPVSSSNAYGGYEGQLSVLLRGKRLEITADVDRAGLIKLKEILVKYEEILALLDP